MTVAPSPRALARLDPAARELVESMWAADRPRSNELPVAAARENLAAVFAELPPGPELKRVEEISIAGRLPARLYADAAAASPVTPVAPVMLFLHGGGWALGGLETVDAVCRELAVAGGPAVLSLDYRLAPEHPFPAALEDVDAALGWLCAEGRERGLDPTRIAIGGESAGANLAAVTVAQGAAAGPIRAQLLVSPAVSAVAGAELLDLEFDDFFLSAAELARFEDLYVPAGADQGDARISPLAGPLPPAAVATLVIGAECDPLRPHGEAYAAKLGAGEREVETIVAAGMVHGFFGLPSVFAPAREAISAARDFLARTVSTASRRT